MKRIDSLNLFKPQLLGFLRRYKRNKTAVFGLVVMAIASFVGVFSPWLAAYPPTKTNTGPTFEPPGIDHPFGTDYLGRDILSDCIHGTRTTLTVGLLSVGLSSLIGIAIGAIAGYFGHMIDEVLMRITEFFLIMPMFFLALVLATLFGSSLQNLIIVIAILSWPSTARLLRSEFLYKKEAQYVVAARSIGLPKWRIIFKEILPNSLSPVVVNSTMMMASAILVEAFLSFLGLGDPNIASWGRIMSNAQAYLTISWWMAVFPGLAITLMVLSFNLIGDGLNDAMNPRLRELR